MSTFGLRLNLSSFKQFFLSISPAFSFCKAQICFEAYTLLTARGVPSLHPRAAGGGLDPLPHSPLHRCPLKETAPKTSRFIH